MPVTQKAITEVRRHEARANNARRTVESMKGLYRLGYRTANDVREAELQAERAVLELNTAICNILRYN